MKFYFFIRLLSVSILIFCFVQRASAAVVWTIDAGKFPSPSALTTCQSYVSSLTSTTYIINFTSVQAAASPYSCNYSRTKISTGAIHDHPSFILVKTGVCDPDETYNSTTGECHVPPESCPAFGTDTRYASVSCSLAGGKYVHDSRISLDNCEYVSQPGGFFRAEPNFDNQAETFCIARFTSTGDPLAPGDGVEEVPPENTAQVPSPDAPDSACFQTGPYETCIDPKQPNCGTRGGNPYCFGESDTCGIANGQHICFPNGARKCSYVEGNYTCINEKTGEKISTDSADHPWNGGNADGNDKNDAQAPGTVVVGGGGQGTKDGATNKSITDLQQALEVQLEGISDALTKETDSTGNAPESPAEQGDLGLDEWDEKIEEAKLELSTVTNQFGDLFQGITSVNLSGSGGQLYCESFTAMNRTYELCLSQYADQLEGIGLIILFLAALLAAYIVFIRH